MASVSANPLPRLILYHQTTHDPDGNLISILPLITQPEIRLTHIIVAAIHINEDPDGLTLNDRPPSDPRFTTLWAELRIAQASGITVLGMLGGAAKGSYTRLDADAASFERYYAPLAALIRARGLQGLDLDVEEPMSLGGVVRLVDRLRGDFGPGFVITLAPVATALLDPRRNLSGFDYAALEAMRGPQIAWYNAQFYCGWGDAHTPLLYEMCVARGWDPAKLVMGLVTTPDNGAGWVPFEVLAVTLRMLALRFPRFGGVMGWEYFNGRPGGKGRPWEWAQAMTRLLGTAGPGHAAVAAAESQAKPSPPVEIDPDSEQGVQVPIPRSFEYHTDDDNSDEDSK
ncbi:family 18 glycoside hydrolase [Biscogniauxia mediterranea]|nr:family 18 glycoside hydrolase [Biscogniauxia mediterranea]